MLKSKFKIVWRKSVSSLSLLGVKIHERYLPPLKEILEFYSDNVTILIFVISGKSKASFGSKPFNIVSGDLLFIHPGTTCTVFPERSLKLREIRIPKKIMEFLKEELEGNAGFKKLLNDQHVHVDDLSETIRTLSTHFFMFILSIAGALERQELLSKPGHSMDDLAISYITEHYREKLTLSRLAKLAGLSTTSYINAFRKRHGTTPMDFIQNLKIHDAAMLLQNSKESITAIAKECGFKDSNYFARLFRKTMSSSPKEWRESNGEKSRKKSVGLFIEWFEGMFISPYYPKILSGILLALRDNDLELKIISLKDPLSRKSLERILFQNNLVGCIILNGLHLFLGKDPNPPPSIPMVSIGSPSNKRGIHSVILDAESIGQQAADIFFEQGHSRVAVIAGSKGNFQSDARLDSFLKRMEEHGQPVSKSLIQYSGYLRETSTRICREFLSLESDERPTAIFCISDSIAMGAYTAIKERQLRIPQDISCIGVDDSEEAILADPPLSTFHYDAITLGSDCVSIIKKLIAGETLPEVQTVGASFKSRGSVTRCMSLPK